MILSPVARRGDPNDLVESESPWDIPFPGERVSGQILNHREQALRSAWMEGAANLGGPRFWLTGIVFLAVYLAVNVVTVRYQFEALGITLWSPDNGLAVLLLMRGAKFIPFVFAGAVLADVLISHVQHSLYVTVLAEFASTLGYAGIAVALRDVLKFSLKRTDLADVIIMVAAAPAAAVLSSLIYCGVLYLADSLPAEQFATALRHFWIGDTVGIIAILAAATAAFTLWSKARLVWRRDDAINWSVFVVSSYLVFVLLYRASTGHAYNLFYLMFLPIIWMGMRTGYAGVAIALLGTQTALFMTASHIGLNDNDFDQFQILMLVLSITGLILGAAVTERERANKRLREQQDELVRISARATAGAMGMVLAHELSQPLSTFATYAVAARRMLQSGAGKGPVIDALSRAEAEAKRTRLVLERIRDLVSVGRMEPRLLDLADVTLKIQALRMEGANARGVDIAVESVRSIPRVKADRVGIEQVLNNIVGNAVDAAAERRDARGRVVIRVIGRDGGAIVQIDDNGPGVAPEMTKSLFEAYQSSKPRGMGLGLTLSRQIVHQHGGRISWQSIAPEGTRFVVELNVKGPDGDAA
jgi:two-component system, LuxR family, sensor kinase FixL